MRRFLVIACCSACGSSSSSHPDARVSFDGALASIDAAGNSVDATPDAASSADAGPGYCGDHIVNGLEACDDGNNRSGDGCSATCVVETTMITPFATIAPQNGVFMTVSSAGTTYVKQFSGTGGTDIITSISPAGVVTPDAVPGILSTSGGDIVAAGHTVLTSGTYYDATATAYAMTIQQWDPDATAMTLVFSQEPFTSGSPSPGLAASADAVMLWFSSGDIYGVTPPSTSAVALSNGDVLGPIQLDRVHGLMLAVDGSQLLRQTSTVSTSLASIFTAPGAIGKIAVDGTGRAYATCYASTAPCSTGAVWVVSADGSSGAPFIDGSAGVYGIAWDESTNELVFLADDWGLRRVPL
jgi:cysteine-rich repeat protein